jgi:rubrerythrin
MREAEPDILEMLIRHESAIRQLYEVFAATFPDRQEFWRALVADEQRHADRLEMLRSGPSTGAWFSNDSGLRSQAIKSSIGYVESQTERAQDGGVSLLQALSIARDLENALIEQHFAKMQVPEHEEIRAVIVELVADTERHRKALGDALDAEKRLRS